MNQASRWAAPRVAFVLTFGGALTAVTLVAQSCSVPGLPTTPEFHLAGRHGEIGCSECHTVNLEGALPRTCSGCHLEDRPPEHFLGDCEGCHSPSDWEDAVVDHSRYLSLEGGHSALECTDCHAPETYEGLDRACESCHLPDRPPNHFTGACAGCHDVQDWNGVLDHDEFFPTPHHGVSACASCHLESGDYTSFSCIDCHEHQRARTDQDHREVGNYSYDSDQCLRCHPRGND